MKTIKNEKKIAVKAKEARVEKETKEARVEKEAKEAKVEREEKNEKGVEVEEKAFSNLFIVVCALLLVTIVVLSYALYFQKNSSGFSQIYLVKGYPKEINSGDSLEFGFVIENNEGKKTVYDYKVFFGAEFVLEKKVSLNKDEKKEFFEKILAKDDLSGKKKVFIEVSKSNKQKFTLWFWVKVN